MKEQDKYKELADIFEEAYKDYVTNVSPAGMAYSKEACLYTLQYCLENKPLKIVDLGSGISSYILRLYKKYSSDNVITYSVDDDEAWLAKAKQFAAKYELDCDNFIYDINNIKDGFEEFDLVIHDYGRMPIRTETIIDAYALLKVGGTIIYDDCHKGYYYKLVKQKMQELSQEIIELEETRDEGGRFSVKVIKK